jgi:hypothetical protein
MGDLGMDRMMTLKDNFKDLNLFINFISFEVGTIHLVPYRHRPHVET